MNNELNSDEIALLETIVKEHPTRRKEGVFIFKLKFVENTMDINKLMDIAKKVGEEVTSIINKSSEFTNERSGLGKKVFRLTPTDVSNRPPMTAEFTVDCLHHGDKVSINSAYRAARIVLNSNKFKI